MWAQRVLDLLDRGTRQVRQLDDSAVSYIDVVSRGSLANWFIWSDLPDGMDDTGPSTGLPTPIPVGVWAPDGSYTAGPGTQYGHAPYAGGGGGGGANMNQNRGRMPSHGHAGTGYQGGAGMHGGANADMIMRSDSPSGRPPHMAPPQHQQHHQQQQQQRYSGAPAGGGAGGGGGRDRDRDRTSRGRGRNGNMDASTASSGGSDWEYAQGPSPYSQGHNQGAHAGHRTHSHSPNPGAMPMAIPPGGYQHQPQQQQQQQQVMGPPLPPHAVPQSQQQPSGLNSGYPLFVGGAGSGAAGPYQSYGGAGNVQQQQQQQQQHGQQQRGVMRGPPPGMIMTDTGPQHPHQLQQHQPHTTGSEDMSAGGYYQPGTASGGVTPTASGVNGPGLSGMPPPGANGGLSALPVSRGSSTPNVSSLNQQHLRQGPGAGPAQAIIDGSRGSPSDPRLNLPVAYGSPRMGYGAGGDDAGAAAYSSGPAQQQQQQQQHGGGGVHRAWSEMPAAASAGPPFAPSGSLSPSLANRTAPGAKQIPTSAAAVSAGATAEVVSHPVSGGPGAMIRPGSPTTAAAGGYGAVNGTGTGVAPPGFRSDSQSALGAPQRTQQTTPSNAGAPAPAAAAAAAAQLHPSTHRPRQLQR